MNIKKSLRIDKIVSLIPESNTIFDIACDHGYIGIKAAMDGKTKKVVFSDINESPLNSCKENVAKYLKNTNVSIEYRQGDGLSVIKDGERCDTVIIAGIGYDLMIDILKDLPKYNIGILILSVQTKVSSFRKYLSDNSYNVLNDEMIIEDGKFYYIQKVKLR